MTGGPEPDDTSRGSRQDGSLTGRRAVVTGSGGALGSRICSALAASGAWVAGLDASADAAAVTTDRLTARGATARHAAVDLLDFGRLEAEVATVAADWGGIDILVNTAGGGMVRPFVELTLEDWNSQLARNFTTVFTATRVVLPYMLTGGWGRIVTLSSVAALAGGRLVRNATAYAAAKSGITGLTKALAFELAESGITVNAIAPGAQHTPGRDRDTPQQRERLMAQIPVRALGEPDDLAQTVVFLCQDSARYITGVTLAQDGGHSI